MPDGRLWPENESGFTLVEVLVSIIVLGIIASGVATAIALFFRTAEGTATRLALSHDSQLLATYLVPDLDNLTCATTAPCGPTPGQPVIVVSGPPGVCGNGVSFQELSMQYTDVSTGQSYAADYKVSGSLLTRSFGPAGQAPNSTISVVHNMELTPDAACFSALPSAAPWTMTVKTGRAGANNAADNYTFSVTGGGRVTAQSPPGAPNLCDPKKCLIALDTNGDGKVDQVIATFDQALNLSDPAGISQWTLVNPPVGVTLQSVAVSGNRALLSLSGGTATDTVASSFAVSLAADANGIRNGANQPASFGATPVSDWMAPVPISPLPLLSRDTDGSGKIDQIVVTFSEPLDTQYSAGTAPWTLSGQPAGVTLKSVAVSGSTATLTLNEGTTVDTVAAGLAVALAANPAGIKDANGNQSSFAPMPVSDGMAPVPISLVSRDTNHDGKVNQVVVTFSEPLATPYVAHTTPWTLSGQPAGVTLESVAVAGSTATLTLNEGTTVDTVAAGFTVALAADVGGIRDARGNQSSFAATAVSDGMGPVVVGLSSTNVPGGTAGKLEAGDQLTLTFSEPLATSSLPTNPTLTLTPGHDRSDDVLQIPGLATIDLGGQDTYVDNSSATFSATVSSSGAVVTIVVGANTSNGGSVRTATTGTTITVTPNTVTDVAVPGNVADGAFMISGTVLF